MLIDALFIATIGLLSAYILLASFAAYRRDQER
jgi:hypothetical protein